MPGSSDRGYGMGSAETISVFPTSIYGVENTEMRMTTEERLDVVRQTLKRNSTTSPSAMT